MRIRTIKPDFWTHPVMSKLDDSTQLLAIALLNYADDEGYFFADPDLVRGAIKPRGDSVSIHGGLTELSKHGYIELREHDTHGLVGRIPGFSKHQYINRPKPSEIKELWDSRSPHGALTEPSLLEGKGTGKGTGNGTCARAGDAELIEIVRSYPKLTKERSSLEALKNAVDLGEDPERIRRHIAELTRRIRSLGVTPSNRYFPGSENYFAERRWHEDPKSLLAQWEKEPQNTRL